MPLVGHVITGNLGGFDEETQERTTVLLVGIMPQSG